ncbi:hypothetical protein LTSEBAI_2012, partial [Salmonella enterica subsp. enterica serovar Baildon str. R6-199]
FAFATIRAHYFCKIIIKLCLQIADNALNYCLQSKRKKAWLQFHH